MKAIMCACSELAILDSRTNNYSLINVVSSLVVAYFPIALEKFSLTCIFERDLSEPEQRRLDLSVDLNKQVIFSQSGNLRFASNQRTYFILALRGLVLHEAGTLTIRILENGAEVCSYPIPVVPVPDPLSANKTVMPEAPAVSAPAVSA